MSIRSFSGGSAKPNLVAQPAKTSAAAFSNPATARLRKSYTIDRRLRSIRWQRESVFRRQLLEAALNRLPIEFRQVLVLFEIERWSYKAIAAALNVPLGTGCPV
jgi:DNA-directed RNA polymerase specialized sigma24 family protein